MAHQDRARPKLRLRQVHHAFERVGSTEPIVAVESVDLDVAPNSVMSIVGPSGCGKTSLLRIMAGIMPPTSGEMLHDEAPVQGQDASRGVVFQQDAVFPWLTVQKNVEYGLRARGVKRQERERVAREWIASVGLEGFEGAFPKELSGGMRKRVDIARAYANGPDVLFMDEPFGALDAQTKVHMQNELVRIWEHQANTIVFVTHDIDEAIFISDRIIVMSPRPGRVVYDAPIPLERPRQQEARLGETFLHLKQQVWSYLSEPAHS